VGTAHPTAKTLEASVVPAVVPTRRGIGWHPGRRLRGCPGGGVGRRLWCGKPGGLSLPGNLSELPGALVAEGLAVAFYMFQKGVVTALGFLFSSLLPGRAPGVDPTPGLVDGAAPFLTDFLPLRAYLVEPPADRLGFRSGHAVGRKGGRRLRRNGEGGEQSDAQDGNRSCRASGHSIPFTVWLSVRQGTGKPDLKNSVYAKLLTECPATDQIPFKTRLGYGGTWGG